MSNNQIAPIGKNNPREIFGWMMYDWANSAFYTTVVGALYGQYLTYVAQQAVGENGIALSFGSFFSISAKSFYPLCITLAVLMQIFLLPLLGAMADYSSLKKRLLIFFCYAGAGATCLMYFVCRREIPSRWAALHHRDVRLQRGHRHLQLVPSTNQH